jgi:hypothetical protein
MEDCITAVPMLPGEAPMMPAGFRANELAPPGARAPVDGVLQRSGNGPVVLRGHEEDPVGGLDGFLQCPAFGRELGIVVVAVQRQIPDGDLGEFQILRC